MVLFWFNPALLKLACASLLILFFYHVKKNRQSFYKLRNPSGKINVLFIITDQQRAEKKGIILNIN